MQKGIYVVYLRRIWQNDGWLLSFCCFVCCKGAKVLPFSSKFVNLKRKQMVLQIYIILCQLLNVSIVKLLRLIDSSGENKSRLCYCRYLKATAFDKHTLFDI